MNQTEARIFINELATRSAPFAPFAARARRLVNNPDDINQTVFGICGLTVMVRSLLQYDLQKFTDLLSAIFEDKAFNGIRVDAGKLLGGRVKQWARKRQHNVQDKQPVPDADRELDFILSRSLGKLLKQQSPRHYISLLEVGERISPTFKRRPDDPYVPLFQFDRKFAADLDAATIGADLAKRLNSASPHAKLLCGFAIEAAGATVTVDDPGKAWTITLQEKERELTVRDTGGDKLELSFYAYYPYSDTDIWQKDGDLALGKIGIGRLMRNVVQAESGALVETEANPRTAFAAINPVFDQPKPYVYAFVNGGDAWVNASLGRAGQFEAPAPRPTEFYGSLAPFGEHILAITGKITEHGDRVRVPVWTWATSFTVEMPLANVAGYLTGYYYGQM
jgi:hypothetical protein